MKSPISSVHILKLWCFRRFDKPSSIIQVGWLLCCLACRLSLMVRTLISSGGLGTELVKESLDLVTIFLDGIDDDTFLVRQD